MIKGGKIPLSEADVSSISEGAGVLQVKRSAYQALFNPGDYASNPCEERQIPARSGRIVGLDGLRTIAVMVVFIGHYTVSIFPDHANVLERVFPGMLGVTLFFVISGFLISSLLVEEYKSLNSISLKRFYIRRLLRLSPALYLYVGVTLFAYLVCDGSVKLGDFVAAITYTSNYYQITRPTTMYYMPVWSLAIEEHFYLLFPILLLVVIRRSVRVLSLIVIGLIIWTFFWRMAVASSPGVEWHWIYWRTDTRIDSILFGVLLTCIMAMPQEKHLRSFTTTHYPFFFGLALMIFSVIYRNDFFRMSARYTMQGLALMFLIGAIVYNDGKIALSLRSLLETKASIYISRISYPLYLWHLTILKFVEHANGYVSPVIAILCAAGSLLVAVLSYHFIETPFLKLRHRYGSHAPA